MKKVNIAFYRRNNVLEVAKDLLGKLLVTRFDGVATSGRIVEVEAYNGIIDRASHAWNGRRTSRNEPMYAAGGICYIYLCYGIHHLFNVVTNEKDIPQAVLIRALEPMEGIKEMERRSGKPKKEYSLTRGPGNLSRALGLTTMKTGTSLTGSEIFLGDDGYKVDKRQIVSTPRIGVDYAGADALLPYRFLLRDNPWVSGKRS